MSTLFTPELLLVLVVVTAAVLVVVICVGIGIFRWLGEEQPKRLVQEIKVTDNIYETCGPARSQAS